MTDNITPIRTLTLTQQVRLAKHMLAFAKTQTALVTPAQAEEVAARIGNMQGIYDDLKERARRLENYHE